MIRGDKEFIGTRLRQARESLKTRDESWTLEGVQNKTKGKIRWGALANWERGEKRCSTDNLIILAELYGKSIHWFFEEEGVEAKSVESVDSQPLTEDEKEAIRAIRRAKERSQRKIG